MKVILSLQRDYRTLSILLDDQDRPVALLNEPRWVTVDEAHEWARKYRALHPEEFGDEVKMKTNRFEFRYEFVFEIPRGPIFFMLKIMQIRVTIYNDKAYPGKLAFRTEFIIDGKIFHIYRTQEEV